MRVALVGTHCTGKTTLLQAIERDNFFEKWKVLPGPTRQLKEQGFPINNDESTSYDNTQLMCCYVDVTNLSLDIKHVISDRCLLDTYIYTRYLHDKGKVGLPTMKLIEVIWRNHAEDYDLLILPSPNDIELVGDKYRNTDKEFRDTVWELFINELETSGKKYFIVSGDTEQRLSNIKNIIKNEFRFGQTQ